ncbi:MAG TPA: outer membrane beta-barrel protein [Terracidiphilus sp.]|jgi:hypothetical protein|nr:outer membrane beta-barrel protein [Terracidiphilus sp.]
MKKTALFFLLSVLCMGSIEARAQVVYSATRPERALNIGVMGSLYQPDYAGNDYAQTGPKDLLGWGGYVDLRLTHWIQLEAEGRWMRFNKYEDIYEDNYLFGPRFPIHETRRFKPYAKVMAGWGKMNFQENFAYGHFANIAVGGGVDMPLTRKLTLRAIDFEYQFWPNWVYGDLKPYGGSVGISYRVF